MHYISVYSGFWWLVGLVVVLTAVVLAVSLMRMATLCDREEEQRRAQNAERYFDVILGGKGK